jgi:glycosyltransferase involved in cell wall biosynthesis
MTARTRVLHVITHLDRGGATDNTLLSVAGLDRSRYEVDLAAGPGALEASARSAADRLLVVPALGRALRPTRDLRAAVALWRLAAGYDVVHTHTAKAGVLGRLAARARGVPVVVHTIHAFPVHDGMSPARRRLLLWAERLATACADRIIAVCQANAAEALALGIATPRQLRVVPSGVPVAAVRAGSGAQVRQALGIPAGAPVVGAVTRFMEQKAPADLIAAGHRWSRPAPTPTWWWSGTARCGPRSRPPPPASPASTCSATATTSPTCWPPSTWWPSARAGRASDGRSPRRWWRPGRSWPPPSTASPTWSSRA